MEQSTKAIIIATLLAASDTFNVNKPDDSYHLIQQAKLVADKIWDMAN